MENAGYIALSRQMALQSKMDVVANNIANMSTSGYKSQHLIFSEYLSRPEPDQPMSMVIDHGLFRDMSGGPIESTGNPLNIAIKGDGFFAVESGGNTYYTRNGALALNNLRELVTPSGNPILDNGGGPIVIPEGIEKLIISANGSVGTEQGEIAQLQLVRFDNPHELRNVGSNMFDTDQPPIPTLEAEVLQGALEGSNVNPVIEMTNMIEVHRSYTMINNLLQKDHDRQSSAIQRLSRLS